ncbi:MAG: phosphoesterase, partial [Deltaproteobacteria bacterium]|nr:phosphoesterase [Deltaproteobacteria bacterium]
MSTSVARIIAGLFLGLFLAACQGGSGSDGQSTALLVTDVHFDPFRQPQLVAELDARPWTEWADIFSSGNDTIPLAGQTCGPALLDSLKANLARLEPAPDLILFPGDILAHNF